MTNKITTTFCDRLNTPLKIGDWVCSVSFSRQHQFLPRKVVSFKPAANEFFPELAILENENGSKFPWSPLDLMKVSPDEMLIYRLGL
jgi:hypothetical protein